MNSKRSHSEPPSFCSMLSFVLEGARAASYDDVIYEEIQGSARKGDKIYVTKIPFAPKQYPSEKHPRMKRYYACHCQLVRTAIRDNNPKIPPFFCYCNGGYVKLPSEVIFGEPVKIDLLESAFRRQHATPLRHHTQTPRIPT